MKREFPVLCHRTLLVMIVLRTMSLFNRRMVILSCSPSRRHMKEIKYSLILNKTLFTLSFCCSEGVCVAVGNMSGKKNVG